MTFISRTYPNWRISQKLSFITLITTGVALLVAFAALATNDYFIFQRQQERKLRTLAEIIGSNVQASLAFGDVKSAEMTLSALKAEKHIFMAALYGIDGKLFAFYKS